MVLQRGTLAGRCPAASCTGGARHERHNEYLDVSLTIRNGKGQDLDGTRCSMENKMNSVERVVAKGHSFRLAPGANG